MSVMREGRSRLSILAGFFLGAVGTAPLPLPAQSAPVTVSPQSSLTGELASLASRAGVIFVGQVVKIQPKGSVVDIDFTVEQPLAGASGSEFTLHEWTGLWPQGQTRYILGERALVFLRGASAAGFSSPVDGAEGVVPVIAQGANAPQLLDVRRLSSAVLRAPGEPLPSTANGAILLSDAFAVIAVTRDASPDRPNDGHLTTRRLVAPVRWPVPLHGAPDAPEPVRPADVSLTGSLAGRNADVEVPHVAR